MKNLIKKDTRKKIISISLLILINTNSLSKTCPTEPEPEICDISTQFNAGRIEFTQLSGQYEISGSEISDLTNFSVPGDYVTFDVNGTLQVELIGGNEENFLDINCDGTVTGQGKDKISGIINKVYSDANCIFNPIDQPDNEIKWDIEIERTYSITGNITNTGEMELELSIDTATIDLLSGSNNLVIHHQARGIVFPCFFVEYPIEYSDVDVSGYTENIKLQDPGYDPTTSTSWNPDVTLLDDKSWMEEMGSHLILNFDPYAAIIIDPELVESPPTDNILSDLFFRETITADINVNFQSDIKTPEILSITLDEEKYYLLDVIVNTSVTVDVDWKESDETHQIEFTYGSTSETVAATGDQTTWYFDAGEDGESITAKAITPSGDSLEIEVNTTKITVPGWAGSSSDWSGSSGVNYQATLDWPVTLETTRTVSSLSLLTGLWGVSGSVSSEFNAKATSDGSAKNGDLTTSASLKLAGKQFSFELEGINSTTLQCDNLITDGDATANLAGLKWQKTINPITAVPGLQSAACGLSGALCNLINSFGVKGEASVALSGSGTFASEDSEIKWDGGSLTGSLSAKVSVNAIPKPLNKLANISFEGGGSGCLEFQFTPNFEINKLGGEVEVGAKVTLLGLSAGASKDWPFGDNCTTRKLEFEKGTSGWVPSDGQLAMAANTFYGAAVWSQLPNGQNRPSGDIKLRLWDGVNWASIISLTNDAEADMAPAIEFDSNGNLIIVYQRSIESIPTIVSELDDFANGLELHFIVYNPNTSTILSTGQITSNGSNDFGPILKLDANDDLHVFWQRANGSHIFGDLSNTVSIHNSSWDISSQTWTVEDTVVDNLSFTYGWSPASFSSDSMLVALLIDTDEDFSTSNDREIFQITKDFGIWNAPVQLTSNNIDDDSPISAYNSNGDAMIFWRQNSNVVQVTGDLTSIPAFAFTATNPVLNEGVGIEFNAGIISSTTNGLTLLWPESTKVEMTSEFSPTNWSNNGQILSDAGAQEIYHSKQVNQDLIIAYSTRLFENENTNLASNITPKFKKINIDPGFIFQDDFEE